MEFITPEFKRKENPIGLYKIWFDDKWFYIGSSTKIRSRFTTWKTNLTGRKFLKSINIKQILPQTSVVRFEVIQTYKSASWLRRNETKEINKHWDNPLFLNRCPDASSPKGMKPYFGYIKPVQILKGTPEYMKPVKIAVFDNNQNLIQVCKSKSEVERTFGVRVSMIKKIMLGERGQPRKFKLKQVNIDGSFLEPIPYIKPKQVVDMSYRWKPINQIDDNGEIIATHPSFKVAAKVAGCSHSYLHRCLKMKFRGKVKEYKAGGYIWKYA